MPLQARRAPTTKAAPPSPCVSRSGSAKIAAASDYADCDAPLTACDEWPSLPTACSAPSGLLGAAPPSGAWARCLLLSVSGLAADDASPSIDGSTPGPLVPAASTGASCCACCGEAADVEPAAAGVAADHAAQDAAGDAAWAPASPASPCSLVVPAAELAPAAGPCDVAALQWCDPGCLAAGLGTSLKLHIVPREHALQLRRLLGQVGCRGVRVEWVGGEGWQHWWVAAWPGCPQLACLSAGCTAAAVLPQPVACSRAFVVHTPCREAFMLTPLLMTPCRAPCRLAACQMVMSTPVPLSAPAPMPRCRASSGPACPPHPPRTPRHAAPLPPPEPGPAA